MKKYHGTLTATVSSKMQPRIGRISAMLTVYSAFWCPHCIKTEKFLKENNIPFTSVNIETASDDVVQKVVDVNGGKEWVVPTLEFNGKWRKGKVFKPAELEKDLREMGVI
jgi:mycoredoxin